MVIELWSNALWLLLASNAIAFSLHRYHRWHANRHKTALRLLALGCALAVLFPVISLTDDLHGNNCAIEDSYTAVKKLKSCSAVSCFDSHHAIVGKLFSCLEPPAWQVVGLVSTEGPGQTSHSAPHNCGRAPPYPA